MTEKADSIIQNLIVCSTPLSIDDDMFFIQLIDTISQKCLQDPHFFYALNCISQTADGFVGEYLWEIMQFQFFHNYTLLSTYLFENFYETTNLQLFLVECLSIYIDDSNKKAKARREIHQIIITKSSSIEIKKFMRNIEKRITSNILA